MTTTVFTTTTPGLPCTWDVDTSCCSTWADYSPALQQSSAEFGAYIMWTATGRRYGLCTRIVRPCSRTQQTRDVSGYYWGEGTWFPYVLNGNWRNCWCGSGASSTPGCCSCQPTCQVYLPGPVYSIPATGVSQDGAIVPVDAWRVDDGKWLVRTDGLCWPQCQDYDADSGTNTFFVTYQIGRPVPSILATAAGMVACEWAKACLGQACALPQRATSIARQGVTISMVALDDLVKNGMTGIPGVDMIIRSINPAGLRRRMRLTSPDDPVFRVTTTP